MLGLLGLAFLLVWGADRLNRPSLLWGISHLFLAAAVYTGFRFHITQESWYGGISLLATSIFLVTLHEATLSLIGRRQGLASIAIQTTAVVILVGVTGFVISPPAGRVAVQIAMAVAYLWSGILFARSRRQYGISLAFMLKAVALIVQMVVEPQTFSTPSQSPSSMALGWSTSVLLALALVFVAVQQSRLRLRQVLRHLPDAVLARRVDGTVLFCNEAFARLAGAGTPAALYGQPTPLLAEDAQEARAVSEEITAIARSEHVSEPMVLERSVRAADGHVFPAEVTVSMFDDLGQRVVLVQIRDLTERKKAEDERLRLATTDEITGLPNRRLLEQQLAAALWECQRHQSQCAVLLIDLDHFKNVNDTMGHAHGDTVIREIAGLLKSQCHSRDLLGRLGGDEFVLVLTDLQFGTGALALEDRARNLCQLLSREVRLGGLHVMLGASIGIAQSSPDGNTPSSLLQHAEVAMYEAKARGRGEWCFFDKQMDDRIAELLLLESGLRQAVQGDELQLAYQPIVDARKHTISKLEALLRWQSPSLGSVSPARFIPVAEQSTLILTLGEWVLREAARQAALWSRSAATVPLISINVSARQFMHSGFEAQLFRVLGEFGVSPSQFELELTETLLASDGAQLSSLLQRLRDAGFGLALDDFGTGYSSLSYLARFNLSTVKIDRSFVAQLEVDSRSGALVRAIIAMGHSLGLKVVAEGVETETQRAMLIEEGCDYLQGYLLGRPTPADSIALG